MPERIQLRRTKGWRKPEGVVVVARPSKWGNPFKVGVDGSAAEVVEWYRRYLQSKVFDTGEPMVETARRELAGKDLACWCPLVDDAGRPVPCHADVLLDVSNPGWTP